MTVKHRNPSPLSFVKLMGLIAAGAICFIANRTMVNNDTTIEIKTRVVIIEQKVSDQQAAIQELMKMLASQHKLTMIANQPEK